MTQEEIVEEKREGEKGSLIKYLIAGAVVILIFLGGAYYYTTTTKGPTEPVNVVNMSVTLDLGAITARGDGLPGYDIDRNGEADYLSKGFGYYKALYEEGGFEYGPGAIYLEEFDINIDIPPMNLTPEDIVESGVGSVVEFSGEDPETGFKTNMIIKTLGASLSTYTLHLRPPDGESYTITDLISEDGAGTIAEKEIDIAGHMIIRE